MSTVVLAAMGVAEFVFGGTLGAMAGARSTRPSELGEILDQAQTEAVEPGQALVEASVRTQAAVERSLSAHMSLRARLVAVSDSALEHAQALKRLHEAGLAAPRIRANPDWRPPPELSRDLPRPAAPDAWQALDRSFDALLAAVDDPEATCVEHARAFMAVGRAARQVADALAGATTLELAAGCSFCAKPREDVGHLIAGPGVYICDECAMLCAEVMEEGVGPDWREQADRRLRGEDDEED